jgi:hypothetical protein
LSLEGKELVVYRQEYSDHCLWVRPKKLFMESVVVDGEVVPRFQPLGYKENRHADQSAHRYEERQLTFPTRDN